MNHLFLLIITLLLTSPASANSLEKLNLVDSKVHHLETPWGTCELLKHRGIHRFIDNREVTEVLNNKKTPKQLMLEIVEINKSLSLLKEEFDQKALKVELTFDLNPKVLEWLKENNFSDLRLSYQGYGRVWESPVHLFSNKFTITQVNNQLIMLLNTSLNIFCETYNEFPTLNAIL